MTKKQAIIPSMMDASASSKKNEDKNIMAFMNKKVILRIFFPSAEVQEYKAKVSTHSFTVEGMEYFIHSDAFYRKGKIVYCDYYYNNPRPIIHKDNFKGILVASQTLKKEMEAGTIKDSKGKDITYEDWLKLDYEERLLFPNVIEFDGHMINKVVNCKFFDGLWNVSDSILTGKSIGIIILVVIIIAVCGMIMYFKLQQGAA